MIGFENSSFYGSDSGVIMNDKFTALGTVTRLGNSFKFSIGFAWLLNGAANANVIQYDFNIQVATVGFYRQDIAYVNNDNKILYLQGEENDKAAIPPILPVGCLLLATWSIYGAIISSPVITDLGNQYVKKSYYSEQIANGSPQYIKISVANGTMSFVFQNSLGAFDFLGFTNYIGSVDLYDGKIGTLKNGTLYPITLKNQAGANNIKFKFTNGSDYVLMPGELFPFRYSAARGIENIVKTNFPPDLYPYVRITDITNSIFDSLATAKAWINNYTDNSLFTNEFYSDGVYQFTCPNDSDFSNSLGFCGFGEQLLQFEDKWNLVRKFADDAFNGNLMNNEFGTYFQAYEINPPITIFGDNCFADCNGTNKLFARYSFGNSGFQNTNASQLSSGNFINWLSDCGNDFGKGYIGKVTIYLFGDISGSRTLPLDMFLRIDNTYQNFLHINTLYRNRIVNAGNTDENLQSIIDNIATNPFSVCTFDGFT